jgi:hypothetical protein
MARGGLAASPPQLLDYLWAWFFELCAARSSNGWSANPISYTEIAAWAMLTRAHPTPWEVSVLRLMDSAYLVGQSRKAGDKTGSPLVEVNATDTAGVVAIMGSLKAKAARLH